MTSKAWLAGAAALAICTLPIPDARACGCFTPPDPSVPIVQAGERILFAMANGQVTAHIQIQYRGSANDFGWLLPLPSVPTLDLGTDELFTQLTTTTQPKYELTPVYDGDCGFGFGRGGGAPGVANGGSGGGGGGGSDPGGVLVYQDSVGPYDYAVLHADKQDDMLNWLNTNHYFVPTGTADAVSAYIHPGAYFLALKLKKGNDTGNLQPVVVKYASDLPMIPIVLTSVAANPHMGIQVWMLGAGRAIPRNYYHTVINDAKIDWVNFGQNYNDVIIAATGEAPGKHSFVTEYAGTSGVMRDLLAPPGRFGDQATLAAQATELDFVQYLRSVNFPFTSATTGVLAKYIPEPAALVAKNITTAQFYQQLDYYLTTYKQLNPGDFTGWTENFQPQMMAADLFARVVTPTQAANALFAQYPYLTRLYTTLSPADMNKDPVFSFNPGLPSYSNVHTGTITYFCGYMQSYSQATAPAEVRTEEGWVLSYPRGTGVVTNFSVGGPASQRIEVLREEGAPLVIADNDGSIRHALGGCSAGGARGGRDLAGVLLLGFVLAALIVRRRA